MAWNAYWLMITPACRYCGKKNFVRKHGYGKSGLQRYRCGHCYRTFQAKYIYAAYKPALRQETDSPSHTDAAILQTHVRAKAIVHRKPCTPSLTPKD